MLQKSRKPFTNKERDQHGDIHNKQQFTPELWAVASIAST
jgi:hypothetical protein